MNTRLRSGFIELISQFVPAFLVAILSLLTGCHPLPWSPTLAGSVGLFLNPAPMMSRFDSPVYIYSPPGLKPELNMPLLPGFPHPGGCSSPAFLKTFSACPRAPAHNFLSALHFSIISDQLHCSALHAPSIRSFEFKHPLRMKHKERRIDLKNNMENYA